MSESVPTGTLVNMMFRRVGLACSLLSVLPSQARSQNEISEPDTPADSRWSIAEVLGAAWDLDPVASSVWPGFRIHDQVLILFRLPDGPTGVIGDDSPPPGFVVSAEDPRVWVLEGPVPDSLAMLRIGATWNGIPGKMTSYPFEEGDSGRRTLEGLIHETFHAYQHHQPGFAHIFRGGEEDTTLAFSRLSSLEGRLLADALTTDSLPVARRRALEALAIRLRKCPDVDDVMCVNQRGVELLEGSADYVAESVMASMTDAGHADSLAAMLRRAPSQEPLERWWYYSTGKAWLYLVDRWSPNNSWTGMLPERAPHQLLEHVLGADPDSLDAVASAVLGSETARIAFREADSVRTADRAAADSVAAAFATLSGTRVRIELVSFSRCLSSSTSRRGRWYEVDGASYVLQDGAREHRYGNGRTWYEARGSMQMERGVLTVVVPGDIVATAEDGVHRLDRPGMAVEGPVVISAPNLEVHAEDATITTTEGAVRIELRLPAGSNDCR